MATEWPYARSKEWLQTASRLSWRLVLVNLGALYTPVRTDRPDYKTGHCLAVLQRPLTRIDRNVVKLRLGVCVHYTRCAHSRWVGPAFNLASDV